MTAGLIAAIAALALATVLGLAYRARNGRLQVSRPGVGVRGLSRSSAGPASGGPASASRSIAGRSIAGHGSESGPPGLTAAEIGGPLGSHATLLQFSSAFCAPCRATRAILADVARVTEGVTHVEVDAESRLDLVRLLDVRRTPTTFVLGPDGQITHKASGQPRKAEVLAAVAGQASSQASAWEDAPVPAPEPEIS